MAHYPDAVNLPFNGEILRENFHPVYPGEETLDGEAFWIFLQAGSLIVPKTDAPGHLYHGEAPVWMPESVISTVIGRWKSQDLRVAELPKDFEIPTDFIREAFNAKECSLDDCTLTLGGFGLQVAAWDRHSRLCSRCGGSNSWIPHTWGKRCGGCGYEHFPHIHPCVIVLVKKQDEFLLTRKPSWPAGRYSLVAGFVDIGESLEECVRREVKEETGIDVKNLRYVGSQCWPFPSQLMAGFVAEYAGGDIVVDQEELEDAAWFSPDRMPESLPGERSIARWIIDHFSGASPTP